MNCDDTTLKLCITVPDGDLPTNARVSTMHFGRRIEANRRSRAKIEAGSGKRRMTCRLRLLVSLRWISLDPIGEVGR